MNIKVLNHADILNILPDRALDSHKGSYGRILILAGSRGYTGAAALAAMGALRTGAGLVYLGVPSCIYAIEAEKLLEPVVVPLPDKNGKFSKKAIGKISKIMDRMDAVLIGSGMGVSQDTLALTKYILQNYTGTVILDADGINVLAEHKDILRGRTSPTILTPHTGEFLRIGGTDTGDKVSDAVRLAKDLGVIVVYKGSGTVITDGATIYRNTTGNPGMAVGGSGDILAGIIASLVGQHISPLEAAACGVWLHGSAGDICASEIGQYGMLPSDMLLCLPRLLK